MYQRYIDGASLGTITNELEANQVTSLSGSPKWSRSVIDKMLSNGKYVPYAIPMELFVAAQIEKDSRTNIHINSDGSTPRKTTRYSSQNVLSGLLVCAECGSNYRRITRLNGEVVWRCSDRVEKGKQSVCKYSPSIADRN
ncbi:recombinase zinc beta ribbon domain-containing protein [Allofournierella sp.]|uniref:recombinase zinc beta ribbon domain-containing protein n=1 Tax=Allofournierella sp. TaxID=1940256 RepID=UPI003AF0A85D